MIKLLSQNIIAVNFAISDGLTGGKMEVKLAFSNDAPKYVHVDNVSVTSSIRSVFLAFWVYGEIGPTKHPEYVTISIWPIQRTLPLTTEDIAWAPKDAIKKEL